MAARTRVQCRVSNMYVCMYVCIYIYIEIQYISNIYMAARTRVQCRASNPCPTAPSTCVYAVCIRVYAVYACSIPCVYACIRGVRMQYTLCVCVYTQCARAAPRVAGVGHLSLPPPVPVCMSLLLQCMRISVYAQTRSRHTHIRALPRALVCGCAVSRRMSNPSIGPPICLGRRVSVDVHACTHPYTHTHR